MSDRASPAVGDSDRGGRMFTESRRTGRPRMTPTAARSWSSWGLASGQLPTSCKHHPGWRPGHPQLCCRWRRGRRVRPEGAARPGKVATHEDLRRSGPSQDPCRTVSVLHAGRELTRDGKAPPGRRRLRFPVLCASVLADAAAGHAGEDGLSGLLLSGGGRRVETCAVRPCGIPSSRTSSRRRDGSRHCLDSAAAAVSIACSSSASSAPSSPIPTKSRGLMNPSLSRNPPARPIASRSGTAQ
jgi:hypothetical protein